MFSFCSCSRYKCDNFEKVENRKKRLDIIKHVSSYCTADMSSVNIFRKVLISRKMSIISCVITCNVYHLILGLKGSSKDLKRPIFANVFSHLETKYSRWYSPFHILCMFNNCYLFALHFKYLSPSLCLSLPLSLWH